MSEKCLWMVVNDEGISLVAESGEVLIFKNLETALFHAKYETNDMEGTWNAYEVEVDKDLYEECSAFGNII